MAWVNTLFSKGSVPVAEHILYFTRKRQDAIASNVANAETPFYKALDAPEADFRDALETALEERGDYQVPLFIFKGDTRVGERVEPRHPRHVMGTLAGLVLYALALETLGYLVTTFLLLSMLIRMLGQRRWPLALAFSALATGGSYALFGVWLGAPLPRGLIPL